MDRPFPATFPIEKPENTPISPAVERLYDFWGCPSDARNEFHTLFRYSRVEGFSDDGFISRRDPSKVIRVDGRYYVYYTCRDTGNQPVRQGEDTETLPSTDWDLADIRVAVSGDGFAWEELGPALKRSGDRWNIRSVSTPDILPWDGRYYLYVQVYDGPIRDDSCGVGVAVADSPAGPFELLDQDVLPRGADGAWDMRTIHDPYPLRYRDRVYLYYKAAPALRRDPASTPYAHGVAIADRPEGPFVKHRTNPIQNSGHETMYWPYRDGIASLLIRNGNEANTIQWSPDGIQFDLKAIVDIPPHAGGPYIPDVSNDDGDGRGILWGLCFSMERVNRKGVRSQLLRFDCSLSRELERPGLKLPKDYGPEHYAAFPLSPADREALLAWQTSRDAPGQRDTQ